jgi:hypothetical protein
LTPGTAFYSGAPEFTPDFLGACVAQSLVFYVAFCAIIVLFHFSFDTSEAVNHRQYNGQMKNEEEQ